MSKSSIFAIVAFSFMSFFLYQGLYNDPKKVESPLIGKEFPKFKLNDLFLNTSHDNDSFQDRRTIINVWASWCLECEREHSHLIALSNNKNFALGLNFARLHIFRKGYGYDNGLRYEDLEKKPISDGIYFIDLYSKENKIII